MGETAGGIEKASSAQAIAAANAAGTFVSYDLNFRSKLWTSEQAIATTKPLIPYIDCLIGNEEDFQKVLGYEVEGGAHDIFERALHQLGVAY